MITGNAPPAAISDPPPSALSETLDFFVLIFRCGGEISSSTGLKMVVDFGIFSIFSRNLAGFGVPPARGHKPLRLAG